MSTDDKNFIFHKVIKTVSQQAVKQGALRAELPSEVANYLAEQLAFTYDLVKKGHRIDAKTLTVLLAQKTLSVSRLAVHNQYNCTIALLLLTASVTKAGLSGATLGPVGLSFTAFDLVSQVYSTGNTCSEPVQQKIVEIATPAYGWLESGIMQALSQGHL